MQEKRQQISPIKQNILQFIKGLNISKRKFYSITGISRGTLESFSGITEETLAKFIAVYENVNLDWLINGEGEILKKGGENSFIANDSEIKYQLTNSKMERRLEFLLDLASNLEDENKRLKLELGHYQKLDKSKEAG